MTRQDFETRFNTVTSAEEMTDLLLACIRENGSDQLELMLTLMKEDQTGIPFLRN